MKKCSNKINDKYKASFLCTVLRSLKQAPLCDYVVITYGCGWENMKLEGQTHSRKVVKVKLVTAEKVSNFQLVVLSWQSTKLADLFSGSEIEVVIRQFHSFLTNISSVVCNKSLVRIEHWNSAVEYNEIKLRV